jgi:hypothetical protein
MQAMISGVAVQVHNHSELEAPVRRGTHRTGLESARQERTFWVRSCLASTVLT